MCTQWEEKKVSHGLIMRVLERPGICVMYAECGYSFISSTLTPFNVVFCLVEMTETKRLCKHPKLDEFEVYTKSKTRLSRVYESTNEKSAQSFGN